MTFNNRPNTHFIREVVIRYTGPAKRAPATIGAPLNAVNFMHRVITDDAREHFLAIYLGGRHQPLAHQIVSAGTATASLVHPREVYQPVVLAGATAIIVGHNHPSGDTSPSTEDRNVTRRLAEAGQLLGTRLLDSLVWAREGQFVSLQENERGLFRNSD